MNRILAPLLGLFVMIGLGLWWWSSRAPTGDAQPIGNATAQPDGPAPSEGRVDKPATVPGTADREAVEGAATAPQVPPAPAPVPRAETAEVISGRVLDLTGAPIGGVAIGVGRSPTNELARSAGDGHFEVRRSSGPLGKLSEGWNGTGDEIGVIAGQGFVQALRTPFDRVRATGLIVVVAPRLSVAGSVVDSAGAPVPGANVNVYVSSRGLRSFPLPLDRNASLTVETLADERGHFSIVVPAAPGLQLRASQGERNGRVDLPERDTFDLVITVDDEGDANGVLRGIVIDVEGQPVSGASVVLNESTTKSGSDGRFELKVPAWLPRDAVLAAGTRGRQPALIPDIDARIKAGDVDGLVLRLGPPTLEIQGKLVFADGTPAKGWSVLLQGSVVLTPGRVPTTTAESLASSEPTKTPVTDEHGAFRFDGLADRPYDLLAYDEDTLQSAFAKGVPAGKLDVIVRIDADVAAESVRGMVLDRSGAPVAGTKICVEFITFQDRGASSWISTDGTRSDETGAFELRGVPRKRARISVTGELVMDTRFAVDTLVLDGPVELRVARRCHFRLVPTDFMPRPESATLLDADENALEVFTFEGFGWSSSSSIALVNSLTTHVYAASEDARSIRFVVTGSPPRTVPVTLTPGQVAEIRY